METLNPGPPPSVNSQASAMGCGVALLNAERGDPRNEQQSVKSRRLIMCRIPSVQALEVQMTGYTSERVCCRIPKSPYPCINVEFGEDLSCLKRSCLEDNEERLQKTQDTMR